MGLKTTNYQIKDKNIVLPEAYAIITEVQSKGHHGVAKFAITVDRESAEKILKGELKPIQEVEVSFTVNRDGNDRAVAYEKATARKEITRLNRKTGEKETTYVNGPFYGWEDDIVESEVNSIE